MSDPLPPSLRRQSHRSEHVENVSEPMRDLTELDDLKDDIRRNLKGEAVQMPWRTGRPLRSAGMDPETGTPITPLAALDLHATVPPSEANKLACELSRAAVMDRVSEGILDNASAQGIPLTSQEQWFEAEERRERQHQLEFVKSQQSKEPSE